jgi:tetratricopeptide (TPR) repeat protein
VELANLYAAGMNNPYQALDTLRRALLRYPAAYVSANATDRKYFGLIGVIARLQMVDCYLAADAYNQAAAALLAIVSDFPGERVTLGDVESPASVAAVRKLQTVLQPMPASLSKKRRVLDTFSDTAVERETRAWLLFAKAQLLTEEGRQVNSTGPVDDAIGALEEVLARHPLVMLTSDDGEEPAGVRALRLIVDICVNIVRNTDRACAELTRYYQDFSQRPALREVAAYAVLYLADVEYNQRHNAGAAYRYYMEVVDQFSDVPVYPRKPGRRDKLGSLAEQRAERAHSEM